MITDIIARYVAADRQHLIAPETPLLDLVDDWRIHFCIPQCIWEMCGQDVPEGAPGSWQTVACVEATMRDMENAAAE